MKNYFNNKFARTENQKTTAISMLAVCILLFFAVSCKDNNEPPEPPTPDTTYSNVNLSNQPLSVVQEAIKGKWKLLYYGVYDFVNNPYGDTVYLHITEDNIAVTHNIPCNDYDSTHRNCRYQAIMWLTHNHNYNPFSIPYRLQEDFDIYGSYYDLMYKPYYYVYGIDSEERWGLSGIKNDTLHIWGYAACDPDPCK
jgi:hypothetical protein